MKNKLLFLSGVILFLLFILFSYLVHYNLFQQFDYTSTILLQKEITHSLDTFFSIFSVLGTFEVSSIVLMFLVIYLFLSRKKFAAVITIVSFGIILSFELIGKLFIKHPSPPEIFARYKHFFTFPTDTLPHPSYSFPSGHSSRTLFLTTIIFLLIFHNKRFTKTQKAMFFVLITIYDLIMLLSRVYLGEHWTSDVIGGVLLGLSLGVMTFQSIISPKKLKLLKTLFGKKY